MLLLSIGQARAQADSIDEPQGQATAQKAPNADTMNLNAALARLGRNPRDLSALLDAGNAALGIGDVDAANGFFSRADQVSPGNARVKAGLASALVRSGNPFDAIPLFIEAEAGGGMDSRAALDRGLAYDLVADNTGAQRFYRQALATGANDEAARRLALSLAIAGDKKASEATLSPLLMRQDKAAWRTRAFALAILGQTEEAVAVLNATLPPALAGGIAPYLRYMPRLTPAQQAAAANFGLFPRASEIGQDDPRVAGFSTNRKRAVIAGTDAGLVPQGAPLGRRESREAQRQREEAEKQRRRELARAEEARRQRETEQAEQAARQREEAEKQRRRELARAEEAARKARRAQPAPPQAPPSRVAVAQVAPVSLPQPPPVNLPPPASLPQPAPPAAQPAAAAPAAIAVAPTLPPPPAAIPPTVPQVATAAPVYGPPDPANAGSPPARPAVAAAPSPPVYLPPPVPASPVAVAAPPPPAAIQRPAPPAPRRSLADAFSDLAAPAADTAPSAGAVDIRRIKPARETEPAQAGAGAKRAPERPAAPSHPSRIWVQLATGRDKAALGFDFRRISKQAEAAFRTRRAFVSAWGQTNRLLTGPFESEASADAFIVQLRRADIDGAFVWTSPAGQVVDVLGAR